MRRTPRAPDEQEHPARSVNLVVMESEDQVRAGRSALTRWTVKTAVACVVGLYIMWAAGFIRISSVPLADGGRAFCLFDDAMISLRYAENLVRGRGLVWNPGEAVEGYSNPLMVLVMALPLLVLPRGAAVLAVQVLGVAVVAATALLGARLYVRIAQPDHRLPHWMLTASIQGLYVLSFWSLLGMETGLVALLTMLCALTALSDGDPIRTALRLGGMTALLYLCRPDAILIGATFGVAAMLHRDSEGDVRSRSRWRPLFVLALPAVATVATHTAFRIAYYGGTLPNTAILKLSGMPWSVRMRDGATFVGPFLEGLIPILGLAAYGMAHTPSRGKVALAAPMVVLVAYQIAVGGEPWAYWRIMAPALPLLVVLACDGATLLARRALPAPSAPRVSLLAFGALAWALAMHNRPFLREALLLQPFQEATLNAERVRTGLALREVTKPSATVAVVGAGAIPFYAERRGIDMLGKCDPYIARLKPDLTGGVSWYGMITIPGHNKYDLRRSIIERMPTCVETPRWGRDDLSAWVRDNYAAIRVNGARLWLLRGSPDVLWERIPDQAVEDDVPTQVAVSAEADLDGDGRTEALRLDPSATESLIVAQGANTVATAVPARWHPWKMAVADADGNGRLDIAVGVHKPTRYIPRPHNCLFIYTFNGRDLVPLWLGSALSRPFTDFAFTTGDRARPSVLFAIEESVRRERSVAEYRWNGFGYTLERRHGAWRSARIARVRPDTVEIDADGKRMTFGCVAR